MEEQPLTRKEFDELKVIVNNHRHLQYDGTKTIDLGNYRYIIWRVLSDTVAHSTGTTVGGDLEIPFSGTITSIYAFADTAGTTNTLTVDVNLNGSTILSTKITLDSTEKTSRTASTQPVLSTISFIEADIFTVDIDAIQTTPGYGLTVVLKVS